MQEIHPILQTFPTQPLKYSPFRNKGTKVLMFTERKSVVSEGSMGMSKIYRNDNDIEDDFDADT